MIGKKFMISGMQIEIVADEGSKWQVHNLTTNETIFMDKSVLEKSIKLGKAEEITALDGIKG
ncbi:MAG: hypothetical protein PVJ63_06920 [Thioalkalispiraceae bacterium]|jgi:hypothetical protein